MQSGSFVRSKLGVVQIFIISAPLGLGKRSLLTNGGTKGYNKKQHHQKNQGVHTGLNVVFGTVWCHSCQSNKYFTHSTVWNSVIDLRAGSQCSGTITIQILTDLRLRPATQAMRLRESGQNLEIARLRVATLSAQRSQRHYSILYYYQVHKSNI